MMRAVVAALALLALAGCGLAPRSDDVPVAAARPAVPLPPPTVWSQADLARIRRILDRALTSPYFRHAGIAITDASGRLVYGRNATRGFAPASTLKTVVAATALATLGADARLDTSFASVDLPNASGTIDDLWLVGNGDPVLDPEQLRAGVAALYRAGVRRVAGDLIVDAGSFTRPEQNPAWAPDDFESDYASGTSAISLNWNVIEFKITPTTLGMPARVQVYPPDPDVLVHGAPITRYATDLQIDRSIAGRNDFRIDGSVAAGGEQSYFRPALDVPLWAGQVTVQMLRDEGISVEGRVRTGGGPLAVQTLWRHASPPVRDLVRQMLFESDNHIAEQLLRVVGIRGGDSLTLPDGSENAGARVERAYLRSLDVPVPGLRIVDGSGLAEADRIAPITLVRLLDAASYSLGRVYVGAFPRAGIEGTVRHHDLRAALGAVRAKSGHIDGVNALAGYLDTRHHGRLAFSFLVNEPDADEAMSIQSGIDRALDGLYEL
jgi:D-alanyl-D-alanine carboxypeptidase/D-alanyl-D-alanine-endopeptidase (penicillin-binding protein 4)